MTVALSLSGLNKRFGALAATANLSLDLAENTLHAIIGPNGAGKTTLIGQITGEIAPDSGTIQLFGEEITRWPVHRRALAGLARSFQITQLLAGFSVEDNVALAVQARMGTSFRFFGNARRDPALRGPARAVLERVGLMERAESPAETLSHGERRQLEIAVALAMNPRVLLLDEPMAGMGPEESRRIVALLQGLKGHATILLVEHDMDAVFALADAVSVLVAGEILMTGAPDTVRADKHVREAYLGGADA